VTEVSRRPAGGRTVRATIDALAEVLIGFLVQYVLAPVAWLLIRGVLAILRVLAVVGGEPVRGVQWIVANVGNGGV
jgi:hypothetical protein